MYWVWYFYLIRKYKYKENANTDASQQPQRLVPWLKLFVKLTLILIYIPHTHKSNCHDKLKTTNFRFFLNDACSISYSIDFEHYRLFWVSCWASAPWSPHTCLAHYPLQALATHLPFLIGWSCGLLSFY